jgi:hypothetical protein
MNIRFERNCDALFGLAASNFLWPLGAGVEQSKRAIFSPTARSRCRAAMLLGVAATACAAFSISCRAARASDGWPDPPLGEVETALRYSSCKYADFVAHRAGEVFELSSLHRAGCLAWPGPIYSNQDLGRGGLFFKYPSDLAAYLSIHPSARGTWFETRYQPKPGEPEQPYPFGNCEGGACIVLKVGHKLQALEPFLQAGRVHDEELGDGYVITIISVLVKFDRGTAKASSGPTRVLRDF